MKEEHIAKFNSDLKIVNSFNRFYQPTQNWESICELRKTQEFSRFVGKSIKPNENICGLHRVIGGIFAFEAPEPKTIKKWFSKMGKKEINFAYIYCHQKYFGIPDNITGEWVFKSLKDQSGDSHSFFAFLTNFLEHTTKDIGVKGSY